MKRTFFISICLLLVIAFACKKEKAGIINNSEPPKEQLKQCRIISGPTFNAHEIVIFLYNEDSSIKSIHVNRMPYTFYYESGKLKAVTIEDRFAYPTDSFETDQNGKVIKKHFYSLYDRNEPRANMYNVSYVYNLDNKIARANYEIINYGTTGGKNITYGSYNYIYDNKGNVIKETDSMRSENEPVKLNYTVLYEHDDKKNPYYLMPLYSISQNSSLISMSPNNITRKHEFFENGKEKISTYSYTYLPEGYPDEVKSYYPQTKDSAVAEFRYECR